MDSWSLSKGTLNPMGGVESGRLSGGWGTQLILTIGSNQNLDEGYTKEDLKTLSDLVLFESWWDL